MVKSVIFDLDDTLCGYWDASKAGLRKTFELHRPEGKSVEEMILAWANVFRKFAPTLKKTGWYETYLAEGEPTRTEQMRLTLESLGISDLSLAELLSRSYMEERDRNLNLFDDAIEVLDWLHSRVPLGLMTNGPADIQRQEIATLGIGHYFGIVLIEGEVKIGKPHEEPFKRALEFAQAKPEEMVMVGNSYGHDIRPAIMYGWQSAWIRRPSDVPPSSPGHVPKPEERPADGPEPTFEIRELRELKSLLSF